MSESSGVGYVWKYVALCVCGAKCSMLQETRASWSWSETRALAEVSTTRSSRQPLALTAFRRQRGAFFATCWKREKVFSHFVGNDRFAYWGLFSRIEYFVFFMENLNNLKSGDGNFEGESRILDECVCLDTFGYFWILFQVAASYSTPFAHTLSESSQIW